MADAVSAYEATLVGDQLPGGDWKWWGGLAADGNIYGIPHNATQVLRFDPTTQQATLVGDELLGEYKWSGGVLACPDEQGERRERASQVSACSPPIGIT